MAKVQTRRTFSVSRAAYNAVKEVAADEGIPAAAWVERRIREAIPGLQQVAPVVSLAADIETTDRPSLDASKAAERMFIGARFCALCLDERGPFFRVPLGRNDADVAACRDCMKAHPRSGRYSFSGGRPDPRGTKTGSTVVGEGNRTTSGRRRT